jgi:hypothetical protein
VLAGCGRWGFDAIDVDAPPSDLGDGDCWSAWTTGPLRLSAPRPVTELTTTEANGDPSLSSDALAMYFSRGSGPKDFYVVRRSDRDSPWDAPTLLTDLSSSQDDTKLTLTADGLVAILSSNRTPATSFDLWEATRDFSAVSFGAPTRTPFAALNTNMNQYDPHVSRDGLRVYYAPSVSGTQVIHLAARTARGMAFDPPVAFSLGQDFSADPSLSPDERVLVYSASEGTNPTSMYYATRTSTSEPFGAGTQMPLYDVPVYDQDPEISYDGCELYFASMRAGMVLQLYVTFVQ